MSRLAARFTLLLVLGGAALYPVTLLAYECGGCDCCGTCDKHCDSSGACVETCAGCCI